MYRWQQAEGRRHAYEVNATQSAHIQPAAPFNTLCGKTVTAKRGDIIHLGGNWFDATCTDCHEILMHTNTTVGAW